MAQPFSEFAGNKRLLWIANEWLRYADRLAEWAMERLANRRDVWSQYSKKRSGEVGVVMLPISERRRLGAEMVTMRKLRRHFSGREVSHLIGLFSISDHSTSKWFAVDIDLHDESVINADEIARANFNAALAWANRLRDAGLDPFLLDSNGVGGYHVWTLLDKEYPLADVFDFADDLRSDWEELGLPRRPEIFPPTREIEPGHLVYTLKLPGRHHRRPHYSRVWNFDAIPGEPEWLEGGDAIERLLETRPAPLPSLKKKPSAGADAGEKEHAGKRRKKATARPEHRTRVCIDLDGVLARYDGWKGIDVIGPPIEGALDFAKQIAKFAEIVVYTSRCAAETIEAEDSKITAGQARIYVIEWLERHGFPFTDVYIGQGKPKVHAFIDDRAVHCSPQSTPDAFTTALKAVKKITGRK